MASISDYGDYDGLGLAELVRKGEVTPQELCEEAIARIELLNPALNAVITPMYDLARAGIEGKRLEGPFAGVPFLLKDLVESYAGVRLTMGSRSCKDFVPKRDSELVRRFKQAGLVILGKTNVPEFGLTAVTESRFLGPCRNPWNVEHTPGGSSGGSAAAVASGMVPLASANDGGGSIRIPASCCGLFGLKPSRGRNPTGPDAAELWQGLAVSHVVTRSVRDCAAMLDATCGPEPGSMYEVPKPGRSFVQELGTEMEPLRIAFSTKSPIGTKVDPDCIAAVKHSAKLLEGLGHKVEESEPEINGPRLARAFLFLVFAEVAADLEQLQYLMGRRIRTDEIEEMTWVMGLIGKSVSAVDLARARRQWGDAARAMGRLHLEYDLFLTPTMAYPPSRIGELQPSTLELQLMKWTKRLRAGGLLRRSGIVDGLAEKVLERVPFTQLANLTGQPAVSVPLYWNLAGLPIGVHFTAPIGDEATLIRLGAQLERAEPWFEKKPPIVSGSDT